VPSATAKAEIAPVGLVPLEEPAGSGDGQAPSPNKATRCCVSCWWKQRSDPEWRSKCFHLAMRRGREIAKVAMARQLAVRMYWMWRKRLDYEQLKKFGSHTGQPGNRRCVQQNTE
jgi:hypothetical protein